MKELKNVRNITALAVFIALTIIASQFLSITLIDKKVGLTFIVTALMCATFDMEMSVLAAIIIDILGNTLFPKGGGFYLPFITTKIASAIIYSYFLHRKEVKIKDIISATTLNTLITSMFLNTLWISQLTHNPFKVQFIMRVPTMAFNYIMHTVVLILIFPTLLTRIRTQLHRQGIGKLVYKR